MVMFLDTVVFVWSGRVEGDHQREIKQFMKWLKYKEYKTNKSYKAYTSKESDNPTHATDLINHIHHINPTNPTNGSHENNIFMIHIMFHIYRTNQAFIHEISRLLTKI